MSWTTARKPGGPSVGESLVRVRRKCRWRWSSSRTSRSGAAGRARRARAAATALAWSPHTVLRLGPRTASPGGVFVSCFQRVTASLFCVRAERPRSPGVLQEGQWLPRGTEQSVCQVSCSPEFLLTRCEIYVTLRRSSPVHTTMTQLAKLKAEISEDLRRLLRRAGQAGDVTGAERL